MRKYRNWCKMQFTRTAHTARIRPKTRRWIWRVYKITPVFHVLPMWWPQDNTANSGKAKRFSASVASRCDDDFAHTNTSFDRLRVTKQQMIRGFDLKKISTTWSDYEIGGGGTTYVPTETSNRINHTKQTTFLPVTDGIARRQDEASTSADSR